MPIMANTRARTYSPYDDWGVDSRGREVNALGQHRTIGYSPSRTPSRGFSGLNEHYARQNYGGTRQAIDNFANDARKAGELVGKDGGRMLDTWENRGYKTHLSDQNPYVAPAAPDVANKPVATPVPPAAGAGQTPPTAPPTAPVAPQGAPAVPTLPPGAPSAENQRFADQPAPKNSVDEGVIAGEGDGPEVDGTGDGGDGGESSPPSQEPVTPLNSAEKKVEELNKFANAPIGATPSRAAASPYRDPDLPMNPGQIQNRLVGGPAAPAATSAPPAAATRSAASPYQDPRAQNVAGAKADGSFAGIRDQYNSGFGDTANWMDAEGNISVDKDVLGAINRAKLQPVADEIAARRDFARGEAPVQYTNPMEGPNANEMNPAPIRAEKMNPYGTATATYGSTPPAGGTMKDAMGRAVPTTPYLKEQSEVQDTKFGAMPSSTVPLGQDDAEQYRAIARGGKIPRSSKA